MTLLTSYYYYCNISQFKGFLPEFILLFQGQYRSQRLCHMQSKKLPFQIWSGVRYGVNLSQNLVLCKFFSSFMQFVTLLPTIYTSTRRSAHLSKLKYIYSSVHLSSISLISAIKTHTVLHFFHSLSLTQIS